LNDDVFDDMYHFDEDKEENNVIKPKKNQDNEREKEKKEYTHFHRKKKRSYVYSSSSSSSDEEEEEEGRRNYNPNFKEFNKELEKLKKRKILHEKYY